MATSRSSLFLLLLAGIAGISLSLYLQFQLDHGSTGVIQVLLYIATVASIFLAVRSVIKLFFVDKFEASAAKANFLLVTTMITSAFIIAGYGQLKSALYIDEMEHHPAFSKGTIYDLKLKGKQREPYKEYSFNYNNQQWYGSFYDPFGKLNVGDTVVVKLSSLHPQYNFAVVDSIYNK